MSQFCFEFGGGNWNDFDEIQPRAGEQVLVISFDYKTRMPYRHIITPISHDGKNLVVDGLYHQYVCRAWVALPDIPEFSED